jgi:uncharacterized membrane protein
MWYIWLQNSMFREVMNVVRIVTVETSSKRIVIFLTTSCALFSLLQLVVVISCLQVVKSRKRMRVRLVICLLSASPIVD